MNNEESGGGSKMREFEITVPEKREKHWFNKVLRMPISTIENLIKPVENEYFLSKNRKMASKIMKKHYVYR